jgi:hypothetical protein
MSKRSDLLKSIIKESSDIVEDAVLNTFLKSRGINPEHVTKNQKVAHSKMGEFLKWKRDHMFTKPVSEDTDKKDMVCLDIPLLIRVLEFTREEMKTDIELHNMVERLINMRHDVPLDMSHYDEITQKLVKENHIAIAMGKMLDDESGMVLTQIEELERGCAMIRSYIGKDYEKQLPAWVQAKITLATDYMSTVGNYLVSKNENVKEAHDPWQDKHFGPTKVIKQKYHVKTDTKSYNVKADNEEHAHKLVTKHAPGSKIVSIEHKGRMMEEVEINELNKSTLASYAKKATDDATYHSFSAGTRSAKDPQRLKDDEKAMKRQSGVNKAIDRLSKEEVESLEEKNVPTSPEKWAKAKSAAKSKFAVYPSAYANGWASKKYKSMGGGWRTEEVEQIDENADEITARHQYHHTQMITAMKSGDKVSQQHHSNELNKAKQDWAVYHANQPKKQPDAIAQDYANREKMYGPGKVRDSVEIDGTPIQEGSAAVRLALALRKEREARELKDKSREAAEKNEKARQQPTQQQENTMDSLAATGAPNDCANTPDDVAPKDKNKKLIQMSKSARIIKSIYNRKNMKEETFDTEKEDKSVATYGKKPKLTDNEKKLDATNGKSSAAAIMTGGTTLTGTPRDVVEIDPMMKLKPGLMGQSGQAIKPKNNNR